MAHDSRGSPPSLLGSSPIRWRRDNVGVIRAFIFDGDDTLWRTEPLYDRARKRARTIVEADGFDGDRWEALERRLDVDNVARFGHSSDRFPASCVDAYLRVAAEAARPAAASVMTAVHAAASTVFSARAPEMPHARQTLEALREKEFLLALLTKGDHAVQEDRIAQSGLETLFDVIEIVEAKTAQVILELVHQLGVSPGEVISVGNSLRSDIAPALEAGVHPVWIDAHVWEYERGGEPAGDQVLVLKDLAELAEVAT
jgi:putative hydrolase of the HAD superfamily